MQVALTPEDKYLVLCSDGLFEFMDNEYIMSIVHHQAQCGWHPSDIAKCLVRRTKFPASHISCLLA